jgi:hypothetical protein
MTAAGQGAGLAMFSYFKKRAFRSQVQNTILYLLGYDPTIIEPLLIIPVFVRRSTEIMLKERV